ncbi:MAG: lipid-A-disaccharide synthase [Cellvibrionaceae bacterium]
MSPEQSQPLRIGILAGESSGDTLGAGLIRSVKARYPNAVFEGIGGPKMIAEGCQSFADQERLAVMGYVEPFKRLPELLGIRKKVREHFLNNPPDVFIGIDSPSFNLSLEKRLKEAGIKTVHYVSPQVWAWRQGRVKKIAKSVDLILTLFPFEAKFYSDHDVPVTFVGHTLADHLALEPDVDTARKALGITTDEQAIALLPGSRGSEVKLLAPEFLAAARLCLKKNPQLKFFIPAANEKRLVQLKQILEGFSDLPVTLMLGHSHEIMCAADAVIMASGTTTLEAMLLKKPMVVAYKFPALSYAILSRLIKTPYIALPNILAGKELVPEIIQNDVSPEILSEKIMLYFEDQEKVNALKNEFLVIHNTLKQNADEKAAEAVLKLIKTV